MSGHVCGAVNPNPRRHDQLVAEPLGVPLQLVVLDVAREERARGSPLARWEADATKPRIIELSPVRDDHAAVEQVDVALSASCGECEYKFLTATCETLGASLKALQHPAPTGPAAACFLFNMESCQLSSFQTQTVRPDSVQQALTPDDVVAHEAAFCASIYGCFETAYEGASGVLGSQLTNCHP